jgi:hypothetical protein
VSHEPAIIQRAEQIARKVLKEEIGILEATRAILPLLHSDPEIIALDDYNLFRAIESETDDLPIGKVRAEWNSDALREKDREIARFEELWRDQVRRACERLLIRSHPIQ